MMPRQLRQRVRMWAAFMDRDVSDVVQEALGGYLDRLDRERERRGESPLPFPPIDGDGTSR